MTNDNEDSRRLVEQCYKRHKTTVNPIIDWDDKDVWDFIRAHRIPYCELYDNGYNRLGCIGCPMSGQKGMEKDFARYPKYKAAYMRSFEKMLALRRERNRPFHMKGRIYGEATAQDVFNWWLEYDVLPGQINIFEDDVDDD